MTSRGRPRKYGCASGTYPKGRDYYEQKNGYNFLPNWCLPDMRPMMRTITAYVVFGIYGELADKIEVLDA